MNVNGKLFYTVEEFGKAAKLSKPTVYRLLYSGKGPAYFKIGRTIRIPVQSVTDWIEANKGGQVLG